MDRSLVSLCLRVFLVIPWAAQAQHVYKCVDGKHTSYQSMPCDEGEQLARQWDAVPDAAPGPGDTVRIRDIQAQGVRDSLYLRSLARRAGSGSRRSSSTGVTIAAARDGGRCLKAKKRRDDVERKLGLDRTFETMQRLSTLVSEACR